MRPSVGSPCHSRLVNEVRAADRSRPSPPPAGELRRAHPKQSSHYGSTALAMRPLSNLRATGNETDLQRLNCDRALNLNHDCHPVTLRVSRHDSFLSQTIAHLPPSEREHTRCTPVVRQLGELRLGRRRAHRPRPPSTTGPMRRLALMDALAHTSPVGRHGTWRHGL